MSDLFSAFIEGWILPQKAHWSRQIAVNIPTDKLRPIPALGKANADGYLPLSVLKDINAQCGKLQYKLDPLWGMSDYYTLPELTQYQLEKGRWEYPCDCDDFAVYARALMLAAGVEPVNCWIWNLIIAPGSQITQAWANHVICGFEYWDGNKHWTGVIDTNTAARKKIFWQTGTREFTAERFIKQFSDIYQVNYYKLLQVPDPFANEGD